MPAAKMTVAEFLDHGIKPTAVATSVSGSSSIRAVDPASAETTFHVMAAAKTVKITKASPAGLGRLILTAKNPAELAATLIKARHDALDGARGFLGVPQGAVTICPDRVGYFQHFAGGSIYWSPSTGAHEVHGAIRQKWAAMGWERSFLGYPRTDETVGRDPEGAGRYNHFQGGSIYWHPQSGAQEIHGAILGKYRELGAEASILGYPATDETATPDRIGRFNHFQRGSIYWTPSTGAHEVHGLIRNFWAQQGWERNPQLGYPLTDELVPHRGVGHTAAPTWRKPILGLPVDVLRLPDEQPPVPIKVSAPAPLKPRSVARTTTGTTTLRAVSPKLTAVSAVKVGPAAGLTVRPGLMINPSILINDHKGRSQDRYSDFEDGVLFWKRSSNVVSQIVPRAVAPGGTKVAYTAAEIASHAGAQVRTCLGAFPGATVGAATFVDTTGYSHDGAGLHNRAHRIRVALNGKRSVAGQLINLTSIIEVRVEIALDPVDREMVGYLTAWSIVSTLGDFHNGGDLRRALHARLDPVIWRQFLVTKIPATSNDPIAILSVKTHTDGRVAVYFEP
jgi:hypothetical protein